DARENRLDPLTVQRAGRAEVADAGNDHRISRRELVWPIRGEERRVDGGERLSHRGEIAGPVVDQRDHSSPFVLASIGPSRWSFAQATRSARPKALNTASILWWFERP